MKNIQLLIFKDRPSILIHPRELDAPAVEAFKKMIEEHDTGERILAVVGDVVDVILIGDFGPVRLINAPERQPA
jgi:hypothetical protein